MARIRYLKPGFFKDEDLSDHPFEVRLLFEGLWNIADREGRLEDRPKRIKVEVFPYDDVDIEKGLNSLTKIKKVSKRPFILRYIGPDGLPYIQILEWNKHQKPHHTEKSSVIPPPPQELLNNGYLTVREQEGMGNGNGNGDGNGELKQASPTKVALEKVFKEGLNIYALINQIKNALGWAKDRHFPDEVILKVCESWDRNKNNVKDQWPWFQQALKKASEDYFAKQNILEGQSWKKTEAAQSIKDIMAGIGSV